MNCVVFKFHGIKIGTETYEKKEEKKKVGAEEKRRVN